MTLPPSSQSPAILFLFVLFLSVMTLVLLAVIKKKTATTQFPHKKDTILTLLSLNNMLQAILFIQFEVYCLPDHLHKMIDRLNLKDWAELIK